MQTRAKEIVITKETFLSSLRGVKRRSNLAFFSGAESKKPKWITKATHFWYRLLKKLTLCFVALLLAMTNKNERGEVLAMTKSSVMSSKMTI
ncbi:MULTISPECIES: hypothetical protein [unclassified Helicobacter]|uniref:hypothetical protein n=1 Tax=unclassified Helicobacter TaxID=2593540 RepID=UPI00115FFAEB|nr:MULTISPECIES: hypothetical protein [unclassified Helicobacter]